MAKQKPQTLAWTALNQKNYQSIVLALFIVALPHLFYLPIALSALVVVVLVGWQVLLLKYGNYQQAQSKPLQFGFFALGLGLIYLQYHTFFGVEAGCAALVVMLIAKAFEIKNYRDAIIQLNFALFVVASVLLYGQGIVLAIAALFGVAACFYGMYQLQSYNNAYEEVLIQDVSVKQLRQQAFKTVLKLLAMAAPLMVVLFLFFPRLPPLWSIPAPSDKSKTGVSDQMSPGDIANLSQSSALAFRVIFSESTASNPMPKNADLYWRAMVLDDFDGQKWTQSPVVKYAASLQSPKGNTVLIPAWYQLPQGTAQFQPIKYKMIIEPTQQKWIYALDYSVAQAPLRMQPDFSLQFGQELTERKQFDLILLNPAPMVGQQLDSKDYWRNIRLPTSSNPQAQAFAKQLFSQSQQNPERYAQTILNWIRQEKFSYTLSPPLLQGDRVDDFLFRTRQGFCEHYASAYVNLMRMVGIPARVVVGYQGGKSAPDGQSWEVRQLDAHAWTEVWFAGRGWVRIDPTAAIAPDRVQRGMQDYSSNNDAVFGDARMAKWSSQWLMQARVWADYVNYQWQSKVVGFDQERQYDWLKKLKIDDLSKQLLVLIFAIAAMIGLLVWWLSRQQKLQRTDLQRALDKLSQRLKTVDLQRIDNEPVLTWLARIQQQYPDDGNIDTMIRLYTQHVYIQPLAELEQKQLLQLLGKYTVTPKQN